VKINKTQLIVEIDETFDALESMEDLAEELPSNSPRYVVVSYQLVRFTFALSLYSLSLPFDHTYISSVFWITEKEWEEGRGGERERGNKGEIVEGDLSDHRLPKLTRSAYCIWG
jgi:hypothetical protein